MGTRTPASPAARVIACAIAALLALAALSWIGATATPAYADEQPAAFDPRPLGLVSDARDQAPWGMCWDFAGIATLESSLIAHGLADASIDLSEEAVVWSLMTNCLNADGTERPWGWAQATRNDSGYSAMMTGYFAAWLGPKLEADVPYYRGEDDPRGAYYLESRPNGVDAAPIPYQVTDIVYLDGASEDELKAAIRAYGAVATGCNLSYDAYNVQTQALWYRTTDPEPYINHAVTVVGWDDDYPRSNFTPAADGTLPSRDGAWLVKNSELAGGDLAPFIWVSYDDDALFAPAEHQPTYAIAGVRAAQERIAHGWDEAGATDTASFDTSVTCANVFEFGEGEEIREIMLMSTAAGARYRVTWAPVDEQGAPLISSPSRIELAQGTVGHAGYSAIELNQPVSVPAGAGAIVLELTGEGGVDVGIDASVLKYGRPLYNANMRDIAGQSYYIDETGTASPATHNGAPINFALRAFCTLAEPEPAPEPDPDPSPVPDPDPDDTADDDHDTGADPDGAGAAPGSDDPADSPQSLAAAGESPVAAIALATAASALLLASLSVRARTGTRRARAPKGRV